MVLRLLGYWMIFVTLSGLLSFGLIPVLVGFCAITAWHLGPAAGVAADLFGLAYWGTFIVIGIDESRGK